MNWTPEAVADLIDIRSGESETLEFKSELPGFSDREKAELLKDVCAMANAVGGTIIYGVGEDDGYADHLTLAQIAGHDETARRVAQIVEAGIEPAIRIKTSFITVREHEVFLVEVPSSLSGPHRFKFNDKFRFVRRQERHVADLTYEQLRSAFGNQVDRRRLITSWWKALDVAEYFSRPLMNGPSMISALVPMGFDGTSTLLEPKSVEENWTDLLLSRFGGGSRGFNYHGVCAFPGGRTEPVKCFAQAERIGPVVTWRSLNSYHYSDSDVFYGAWFVDFIRDSYKTQKRIFERNGLGGAFFHLCAIRDIVGWQMNTVDVHGFEEGHCASVPSIEIGPYFIEDLEPHGDDSVELFGPIMDRLWQTYDLPECPPRLITEPHR